MKFLIWGIVTAVFVASSLFLLGLPAFCVVACLLCLVGLVLTKTKRAVGILLSLLAIIPTVYICYVDVYCSDTINAIYEELFADETTLALEGPSRRLYVLSAVNKLFPVIEDAIRTTFDVEMGDMTDESYDIAFRMYVTVLRDTDSVQDTLAVFGDGSVGEVFFREMLYNNNLAPNNFYTLTEPIQGLLNINLITVGSTTFVLDTVVRYAAVGFTLLLYIYIVYRFFKG